MIDNKTAKADLSMQAQRIEFSGLSFSEKDLAKEIGRDLDLPPQVIKIVMDQLIRRLIEHMIHNQPVTIKYLGHFRLRKSLRHWTLHFKRLRSLDNYINARLDNDQNQKQITMLNPLVTKSWYGHLILDRRQSRKLRGPFMPGHRPVVKPKQSE